MDNTNYIVCDICGNLIDNNNIFKIQDKEICKSCIQKNFEQNQTFNPLATFMCSLVPGVAHIYLGRKYKGILLLQTFILNIALFISSIFAYNIFYYFFPFNVLAIAGIFITPIFCLLIYMYSFIDGNNSRKYIENNIYIADCFDKFGSKLFNKKDKKVLEEKIIDKRLQ